MNALRHNPRPNCVVPFPRMLWVAGFVFLLGGTPFVRADFLPNNFWPNSAFESGTNLNQTDGTPTNWSRGGSDATICQVITNNSGSPGHALASIDANGSGYGEWYADVTLSGHASPGDALNIQWYEMYNLDGPEMRLTVLFFNAGDNVVGETHFVTAGTSSAGWVSTIADSTFTKRNRSLAVPLGAVKMRCSLVSGGSETVTGVMVIDDLSVARSPLPTLLSGNIWVNPSFEIGTSLDQTGGSPTNWNRGGSDASICQVITNNFASSSHALALVDTNASGYGEWYSDVTLNGKANSGDVLNVQWLEMFSITNGEMRLTALFFDAADGVVGETHFVATGQSAGWQGSIGSSGFARRNQSLVVPPGAVKMRFGLVSGGPEATRGVMVIDDLSVALPPQAALLPGNFWLNSTFETGSNLNQTNGTPANWNRGGNDSIICLVITNNFTSSSHALALVDTNGSVYGEWYSDVALTGNASPGDLVDIKWFEMYGITNGEMRLTALFFNSSNAVVGETHFVATGNSFEWMGTIVGSPFVTRQQQVLVPPGAVKMRFGFVSGGPEATIGVMVVDDLSAAVHPVPPTVLAGNFFPNATFEDGAQLDNPTLSAPAGGWSRGGSDGSIDQVTTNSSVSPTHSLSLLDNNESGYGEWYVFFTLPGVVEGDVLDLQWFQLYSVTNGSMRLSFAFTDAGNVQLENRDYNVTDQSPGWLGSVAGSPFERRSERLLVPAGTVKLRVNFASGGAANVVGTMVIDDLSVRIGKLAVTDLTPQVGGFDLSWFSVPGKAYTVQFAPALGSPTVWIPLATNLVSNSLSTSYSDTAIHGGNGGFYRVIEE